APGHPTRVAIQFLESVGFRVFFKLFDLRIRCVGLVASKYLQLAADSALPLDCVQSGPKKALLCLANAARRSADDPPLATYGHGSHASNYVQGQAIRPASERPGRFVRICTAGQTGMPAVRRNQKSRRPCAAPG